MVGEEEVREQGRWVNDGRRNAILPDPPLPSPATPEGEMLKEALSLYRKGDFRTMRNLLLPLLKSKDPAVSDAARELLQRISVDPVVVVFLVGCLIAWMIVVGLYVL